MALQNNQRDQCKYAPPHTHTQKQNRQMFKTSVCFQLGQLISSPIVRDVTDINPPVICLINEGIDEDVVHEI